jgi:hypothetical protein
MQTGLDSSDPQHLQNKFLKEDFVQKILTGKAIRFFSCFSGAHQRER